MASQCIGLHRHGKASPLIKSRFETEELRLPLLKKKEAANEAALAFMRLGVFGIGPSIHQVPFLHAHPNGRQFAISLRQPANRVAA